VSFKMKLIGGENPKLKAIVKLKDPKRALNVGRAMIAFTLKHPCLGLAANQFGIMERVCIAKVGGKMRIFIDPQIISSAGSQISVQEGCLTWPNRRGNIERPWRIMVKRLSINNPPDQTGSTDLLHADIFTGQEAIILEHEIDHLNGTRCIDKFIKEKL